MEQVDGWGVIVVQTAIYISIKSADLLSAQNCREVFSTQKVI